jgi:hypothetical protein
MGFLYLAILVLAIPFLSSFLMKISNGNKYWSYPISVALVILSPLILIVLSILPVPGLVLLGTMTFLIPLVIITQYLANLLFFNEEENKTIS